MSLKNDLMFPFGNPYKERLEDRTTQVALHNVLKLAKDKANSLNGEPEELMLMSDDPVVKQSITIVEQLLQYIDAQKETSS